VPSKDSFAKRLRKAIKQRGISQRKLARDSGLGHADVNQYAQGKKLPSVPSLLRLAKTLELLPGDLLNGLVA
jgi:transcriptional regulator with XRE-family HTH domain